MSWTKLWGWLLNVENVKSIDSVDFMFGSGWASASPILVWFLSAGMVLLAVQFYSRFQQHAKPRMRHVMTGLRAAMLILLVWILADPIIALKFTNQPRPWLWVLFDGTDSMAIADRLPEADQARLLEAIGRSDLAASASAGTATAAKSGAAGAKSPAGETAAAGKPAAAAKSAVIEEQPTRVDVGDAGLTRQEYVKGWVGRERANTLQALAEKYRLKFFLMDRVQGVRELPVDQAPGEPLPVKQLSEQLTTTGTVTPLGRAIEDLSGRQTGGQLAGVVVVSDFDQNSGPPPVTAGRKWGLPVFTIGVGAEAAVDLAIDLQAPLMMKKAERNSLMVTVRQTGLSGQTVQVKVTSRRDAGETVTVLEGETVIGERQITLDAPDQVLEFPITPTETGRFTFTAAVAPVSGELVEQNNKASREVNVRDDFLRLMFVEYEPTWEWRFIKEVFHRDKLVGMRGFRTFLRSADPNVRKNNELFLSTLTPKRSDFFANDVIFLGDMPASALNTRYCEMVKEFVSTFGGGLVVIAGPRFGPSQLAQTPLAELLPVVVDAGARVKDDKPFALQLTAESEQVDFMKLGATDAEHKKAWANLGPLNWYQPVARLHPLATPLAVHPTDLCSDGKTKMPLIAVRRYGRGEVVYVGFNETWRLRRRYGELYYRQFWGQMIHRLGLSHALGSQKRFVARTDRPQYQPDDKVVLTVEAYDANFEPLGEEDLPERKLSGEVIFPGQGPEGGRNSQRLSIPQLRDGVFEARIPVLEPGEHQITVKDPVTGENSEVFFQVSRLSLERRSGVRNTSLQQELASATGGRAYDLSTADKLLEDFHPVPRTETTMQVRPLWNTWACFFAVVLLMLAEWLLRKMSNLA